jgi:hypothetical protein
MEKVYDIISKNHFNSNPEVWHCNSCKTYDYFDGSYITFVEEEYFLENLQKCIENAYKKSKMMEVVIIYLKKNNYIINKGNK